MQRGAGLRDDPGRVVATIFKATQPFDEDVLRLTKPGVSHNAAHHVLVSNAHPERLYVVDVKANAGWLRGVSLLLAAITWRPTTVKPHSPS